MLFSGKKNIFKLFGCLKIRFTENQFRCLVCSNIFIENALHSQATQFSIHFLNCKHVDNESIPHSFTKETKCSKKIHQIRSNWDHAVKEKVRSRGGGKIERRWDRAARCCDQWAAMLRSTIGMVRSSDWSSVCGCWTGARGSSTKSLLPLSLRSGLSLSLFPEMLWSENTNWK